MGRKIGYARVSTGEQDTVGQRQALRAAGCKMVFEDVESGASRTRPQLKRCMEALEEGDVLVVARFDRLARSVPHLYEIMEDFKARGVGFRSLRESFDTTTPSGRLMVGLLTLIAQFERELIHDRSLAGIAAARERGVMFGNPGIRARDPVAIANMKIGQAEAYLRRARSSSRPWIGHIVRMRPHETWKAVHDHITRTLPAGQAPTMETMVTTVRRLVAAGDIPQEVLERAPNSRNEKIEDIARSIHSDNPGMSLRGIGRELERRGHRPARAAAWSAQTVARLLGIQRA